MDMARYGKYQLGGLNDQRICVRSSKREKKHLNNILERQSDNLGTF